MFDLDEITELAIENIDLIFDYYNIEYVDYGEKIKFKCPIHNGNSIDSVVLHKNTGHWKCYSNHCEKSKIDDKAIGANILGLIRGLNYNQGKILTYSEALKKLTSIVKQDLSEIPDNYQEINRFIKIVKYLDRAEPRFDINIPRLIVRSFLKIPSEYFINRGFTEKILDKYDVGLCLNKKSEMYNRVVVPVYQLDKMIGCIGRTVLNIKPKWKNLFKFKSEDYLYNIWYAKPFIKETQTAILVEGQGDVWKLEECGIYNSLGLFGDSLTNGQQKLLEKTGATNIILLTDNDLAGMKARSTIREQIKHIYDIYDIIPTKKDVGDMSINEIKSNILPNIDRVIKN